MPYFYNDKINLLLIHIPKTGGTSLEIYFSKKFNIALDNKSLYSHDTWERFRNISYQHQTYLDLKNNNKIFKINFDNNLKIITSVRNPYYRIISDLFYYSKFFENSLINENTSKNEMFQIIKTYFLDINGHDNHRIPQYMFLLDENGYLLKNITIMKTEDLIYDMAKIGCSDFYINEMTTKINKNYMSFLNDDSINLINKYYEKDFLYFNYEMIIPGTKTLL